jgi:hypothetical protein
MREEGGQEPSKKRKKIRKEKERKEKKQRKAKERLTENVQANTRNKIKRTKTKVNKYIKIRQSM